MEKKNNASKIVVLGKGKSQNYVYNFTIARVGKTSLTVRFCKN